MTSVMDLSMLVVRVSQDSYGQGTATYFRLRARMSASISDMCWRVKLHCASWTEEQISMKCVTSHGKVDSYENGGVGASRCYRLVLSIVQRVQGVLRTEAIAADIESDSSPSAAVAASPLGLFAAACALGEVSSAMVKFRARPLSKPRCPMAGGEPPGGYEPGPRRVRRP